MTPSLAGFIAFYGVSREVALLSLALFVLGKQDRISCRCQPCANESLHRIWPRTLSSRADFRSRRQAERLHCHLRLIYSLVMGCCICAKYSRANHLSLSRRPQRLVKSYSAPGQHFGLGLNTRTQSLLVQLCPLRFWRSFYRTTRRRLCGRLCLMAMEPHRHCNIGFRLSACNHSWSRRDVCS